MESLANFQKTTMINRRQPDNHTEVGRRVTDTHVPVISVLKAGTAIVIFFIGWNSWLSIAVMKNGNDIAAIQATAKDVQSTVHEINNRLDQPVAVATSTIITGGISSIAN